MREHGIDIPDPSTDGRIRVGPGEGIDPESDEFQAAQDACGDILGPPPELSEADQAVMQDALLEFARCMREHGIDMPDPTFDGGCGGFAFGLPEGVSPDDPAFQDAQEACQPIMDEAARSAGLQRGPGAAQ
jgi:hypothetical protein